MATKQFDPQALCESLMKADSEVEVINLLKSHGYWDRPQVWRFYGDKSSNYPTIGNQQSRPESALVEKLTNAIDARLMGACMAAGLKPDAAEAPGSMQEAVAQFFGSGGKKGSGAGVYHWDNDKRLEIGKGITLALTGSKRRPSITIADVGEGQRPSRVPETFLSLDRENKVRVQFVQGKFNMGGTGVLEFCGEENLQLVITKRDPKVALRMGETTDPEHDCWSFTLIRKETDTGGRNSIYTYLAPVGCETAFRKGALLTFRAAKLPLMPERSKAYARDILHGSLVKMYEYDLKGFSSYALRKGLLSRLEVMLPNPALPMRLHECRDYSGHEGSFDTTLLGLSVRLDDNRADNLEPGFPDSVQFMVNGERMTAKVYAFKPDKAKSYITGEGVILTVNGQTHGTLPRTLFSRDSVKMTRIADSLLLTIDCSGISQRAREKLFMPSRDRLRKSELQKALEDQIEEIISQHQSLKDLRERRQREQVEERLKDDKPLEEVLEALLKNSPTLSALFASGSRLMKPFKQIPAGGGIKKPGTTGNGEAEFLGKKHPTFFKYPGKPYGHFMERGFEIGRRCRIELETDAVNDYFDRPENPGEFILSLADDSNGVSEPNWNVSLRDGAAQVSMDFTDEMLPGQEAVLQLAVHDPTRPEPFVNLVRLRAKPKADRPGGKPEAERGKASGDGNGTSAPSGIAFPKITPVEEKDWAKYGFDAGTACQVVDYIDPVSGEASYEFRVNVHNAALRVEQKRGTEDARLSRAKFVFGTVLIGLGVMHRFRQLQLLSKSEESEEQTPGAALLAVGMPPYVAEVTRALAPFVLPMIDNLGALEATDVDLVAMFGDEE